MRAPSSFTCAVLAAALALAAPDRGEAGDWHSGKLLFCSDCHTTHNSSNGSPMRYDGSPSVVEYLLRDPDEVTLCFACHDGSSASAPDVLAPVTYVADPAGGMFAGRGGTTSGTGHDLLQPTPVQVPDGSQQMILTCASCHDTHGTGSYRNLLPNPAGGTTSFLLAVDQAKVANGANAADVYSASNLTYRTGTSAWCVTCHDLAPTQHSHPYDVPIYGAVNASYAVWQAVTGNRVPVENPTDPTVPSQDDTVTCLSCHFGHGGGTDLLREPNGPGTLCAQCHVQ